MKFIFIFFTFFAITLNAAEPAAKDTSSANNETNPTKTYVPTFYKDYKWDVGLIGGMTFDGAQIDDERYGVGAGLHVAYHLNDVLSLHGEGINLFTALASDSRYEETTSSLYIGSVQYDFSAERTYSLYAKAGLGYEMLDRYNYETQKNTVSLMGFGFRYMFSEHISGYVEGRWKMRLNDISEPDNSLVGTIGIDYHFGLDDKKAKLIAERSK